MKDKAGKITLQAKIKEMIFLIFIVQTHWTASHLFYIFGRVEEDIGW